MTGGFHILLNALVQLALAQALLKQQGCHGTRAAAAAGVALPAL